MAKKPSVKVRILKPIGQYSPGQVIDLPLDIAEQICTPRKVNNGHGVVEVINAITQEDFDAALKAPLDLNGLSQGDMAAMGVKNVVATPVDPKADEALEAKAKLAQEAALAAEKKAAEELAALDKQREMQNPDKDPPADPEDKKGKAGK